MGRRRTLASMIASVVALAGTAAGVDGQCRKIGASAADPPGDVASPVVQGLRGAASALSPAVRTLFERGMTLYLGGCRAGAAQAFEEAVRRDGTCALCFWGIALAVAPDAPAGAEEADTARLPLARRAAHQALEAVLVYGGTELERELVGSMYSRYSLSPLGGGMKDRDRAWVSAMRHLARRFGAPGLEDLAAAISRP